MPISDLVITVAHVRCFRQGRELGEASGFFYVHDSELHFITNRHVIVKEEDDYFADELRLKLHTNANDIRQNEEYSISLYDSVGKRKWLEHPALGKQVDIVALALDQSHIGAHYIVKAFGPLDHIPPDIDISVGEDVLVIGYPLGFHDVLHNLPIVRNATMASVYPVPFQGKPFILIDARLHRGTSGSPVLTKATNIVRRTDGSTAVLNKAVNFLVGIHSATLDIDSRDARRDEPLGLNAVWFASLIPEIVQQKKH